MLPMPNHAVPGSLPLAEGPVRALLDLFATRPPGLPDGLHTVVQLRRIAMTAGLDPEPGFDLDAYLRDLKARLYGPEEEAAAGGPAPSGEAEPSGESVCPAPVDADIPQVAILRDRLEQALLHSDDRECALGLNAVSRECGLFPGVDGEGRLRVLTVGGDFGSCLAAVLVPAAMSLSAPGGRRRLRSCGDARCQILFLDRSRDGRGRYCSSTCSARSRARARRARAVSE